MSTQPATDHETRVCATASGARIVPIPATRARAFFIRLDEPAQEGVDVAFGAMEDDGSLIGAAVLSSTVNRGAAMVTVLPARRRLKVGSDLLHALLEQAAARGIDNLRCRPRRPSVATDGLLRSLGLVASRQVRERTITIVASVPAPTVPAEHGPQTGAQPARQSEPE